MSDAVIAALVGGLAGVIAALIPVVIAWRKAPSRLTTDAIALVGAQGEVRENLTDEIGRLATKNRDLEAKNDALEARVDKLERALRQAGIDPALIE